MDVESGSTIETACHSGEIGNNRLLNLNTCGTPVGNGNVLHQTVIELNSELDSLPCSASRTSKTKGLDVHVDKRRTDKTISGRAGLSDVRDKVSVTHQLDVVVHRQSSVNDVLTARQVHSST